MIAAQFCDEAVIAPLLAKWCREDCARCSFLERPVDLRISLESLSFHLKNVEDGSAGL